MSDLPPPMPVEQALVSLQTSKYGVCPADLHFSPEESYYFDQIQIENAANFDRFGPVCDWVDEIAAFLAAIGPNSQEIAFGAAGKISQIIEEVMSASRRACAWVHLGAFVPTAEFDAHRWHMDGPYYKTESPFGFKYKFAATLVGDSTLFYSLPRESAHLRELVWLRSRNKELMNEIFPDSGILKMESKCGALFISGDYKRAALHSEPPISQSRLFLSIIAGTEEEIQHLKTLLVKL